MCILLLKKKYTILTGLCLVWEIFLMSDRALAEDKRENSPILIISSYNPETFQTSNNISEFLDEYKLLGGDSPVFIENMNCKSFSESVLWKQHMADILGKYTGDKTPDIILLLGQEAWASYLSQDDIRSREIPVLCGMVSKNAILLPEDTTDLKNWEPESTNFEEALGKDAKIAGFAYHYDVAKNIQLIKDLYPQTQHIAFISDNSYGGVTMQAHVRREMQQFPEFDLIVLDGRQHTIYTIVDQMAVLPVNTVVLVGTWRVDKNESYFMRNATYSMMSANLHMPAFSLASVGLEHWVIGGYSPQYRSVGKDLARKAVAIQKDELHYRGLDLIPDQYIFDFNKLEEFNIKVSALPAGAELINKEVPFVEKYYYQILAIGVVFFILIGALIITWYYYWRTKRLKDKLLKSEGELVAAKERAEESDRLKSAFLANMSHEIRTPLNAIVGFSNVLTSGEYSGEEQKTFVEVIQTNSDLLLRLIGDILDISRLETDKLRFSFEECEIVGLCQKVLTTTSYAKKENVEYVFHPIVDSFVIETDVQRLQQILINLLSNANKFTTEGQITLEFRIDEKKQFVEFSVTDTGCGIPLEKQEKVFERFEKLNEYAQGTGLGLAICRITVEKLGGKIGVDKEYKAGTRFVFTHPVRQKR